MHSKKHKANARVNAKPRMWEDAPPEAQVDGIEKLTEFSQEAAMARKYFTCGCGAAKGENCKALRFSDGTAESSAEWHETYDVHQSRRNRWTQMTELERAMIEAVESDDVSSP